MRWFVVSAAIVGVQFLAALAIGVAVGYSFTIPILKMAEGLAFALVMSALGFALVRTIYFAAIREADPVPRLLGELRDSAIVIPALLLSAAQTTVLSWLKNMLPHVSGFWADPPLAELDRLIFGVDPWRLALKLSDGEPLQTIYATWPFVVPVAFIAVAFAPESRIKARAMISYFLIVGAVGLGQFLLPAAGPIYYEAVGHGSRFADLPIMADTRIWADYLWSSYSQAANRPGSGISAMPSGHVAISVWIALCLASYFPRLKWAGRGYVAVIWFGSVYLGWHYAVDGLVSLAIAVAAYRISFTLISEMVPVKAAVSASICSSVPSAAKYTVTVPEE